MDPNDGLPGCICYKCLFQVDKCSQFRNQCLQSEMRLRQLTARINEYDNTNTQLSTYNNMVPKIMNNEYIVEDSVVMVVDPSMDYDSSEESDNMEHPEPEVTERDNSPDGEPTSDSFPKNVFMCQYCDQAFVSEDKCKEHEHKFHDPNLPYNCVECSLVFAERNQYIQHTKQVHCNDKPFVCPECDKCFSRRSDLRKHSIVHTGIRPFQCHHCLKSFSRNTNLSKHLRIHSGSKPHVCPLCPRSFVDKGDLEQHVLIHSGMKPYACRYCPLSFGRRDKLIKHELKHVPLTSKSKQSLDSEIEQRNMIVNVNPFSNLVSTSNRHVSENLNTNFDLPRIPDHISGENSFMNQVQKNPSTSGKQLQSPPKPKITLKNKPKNIKCHQCPKRFSSLDSYKSHVSIAHIGSRIFQCKECFKKFIRKKELDRHSSLHCSVKSFSCSQCIKSFVNKEKLIKHEQTHNECAVLNLPCIECGATFEKKEELVAHIKSHFVDDFEKGTEGMIKKETEHDFPVNEDFYDLET